MAAVDEPYLAELHNKADLVVPDGTPLVWVGRALGAGRQMGRVAGVDFLDAVCRKSLDTGQSHYFYGGKPGVAEAMVRNLQARYPGLNVLGYYSPPMRTINAEFKISDELLEEIAKIRDCAPDFLWVGISSPKQEYWMMKVAPLLQRGVIFGVGAAFDFESGQVKRAPKWMRENGLEWLHRLKSEPSRLWRRYLIQAPRFIALVSREVVLSKFSVRSSRQN
jgi:N-acetylglucosaminyldiphosphoundecaprenol N-acetyl-beta-D-mannosaminyltransferase